MRHIRVAGRVVFTSDGAHPLGDARRLHRLRRSFCKSWRNAKWRDLLLAFWYWLGDGASTIEVPMGEGVAIRLRLPPFHLVATFGIREADDVSEAAEEGEDDAEASDGVLGDDEIDDEATELDDDP